MAIPLVQVKLQGELSERQLAGLDNLDPVMLEYVEPGHRRIPEEQQKQQAKHRKLFSHSSSKDVAIYA